MSLLISSKSILYPILSNKFYKSNKTLSLLNLGKKSIVFFINFSASFNLNGHYEAAITPNSRKIIKFIIFKSMSLLILFFIESILSEMLSLMPRIAS
jgi:hypothetical protein